MDEVKQHGSGPAGMHLRILDGTREAPNGRDLHRERYDERYKVMARAQNSIGWQRFMEGIVCNEIRAIHRTHSSITGLRCNTECWGKELVTRLPEVMHGQWLYRNVQVHDRITGTLATQRKEELQMEIELPRSARDNKSRAILFVGLKSVSD